MTAEEINILYEYFLKYKYKLIIENGLLKIEHCDYHYDTWTIKFIKEYVLKVKIYTSGVINE